jgi:MFS family permease
MVGVDVVAGDESARRTLHWLCLGSFINASCSAVLSTAQTGLGLTLAPSRAALLARMSMLVGVSALGQVLLLPLCGRINDTFGRKPVMLGRSAFTFVFAGLLALRPSYGLLSFWRGCSNFSWMMWQTSVHASLADVFEGQDLAVAVSKVELYQGLAMLVGPIIGGRLAEWDFLACFALSSCCGAANVLVYSFGLEETLLRRQHSNDPDGSSSSEETKGALISELPRGGLPQASLSPLGFLRLFVSGRQLAMLTVAWTVSEMCEGTYEIE